jgi:glycosyltransferase involved in cell wall biosynthesis
LAPGAHLPPGSGARLADGGVAVQRVAGAGKPVDVLPDWFSALAAAHAAEPLDVIHGYFANQAGFVAVYAGRTLGVPAVVSVRGNDLDRAVFDPGRAAHTLYALAQAQAVTANSQDLARKAQALAPGARVTLVPNGVDAGCFAPAPPDPRLRAAFGLDERPVIGFVGEARAKKGLGALLLAFAEVARRRPAQLLLVGGARADDKDLVRVFRQQNPGLKVRLVPYDQPKDMPACYNLIDVLALPSVRDGLPNALLEGMACARAVVGTLAGGIPDALRDGENGRLVPIGDVGALAGAIDDLLDDPEERARLGANARATVMREFPPEREVARTLEVYGR